MKSESDLGPRRDRLMHEHIHDPYKTPHKLPEPTVCPDCGAELTRSGTTMICKSCNQRWAIRDGIYDFKAPLEE